MTNPFVASVLILVIAETKDPFIYKLEWCCKCLENDSVPECASEGICWFVYFLVFI